MEKIYAKYGRMIDVKINGESQFYMYVSKTPLPYKTTKSIFLCKGRVPEYNMGYPLILYGEWDRKDEKRWTFNVSDFEEDIKSEKILESFLVKECPGIGPVQAKKIASVDALLWKCIEHDNGADILSKNTGITKTLCSSAISLIKKKNEKYKVYKYLCKYGITDVKVERLIEEYGNNTLEKIKKNPYETLNKLEVSFKITDKIAFVENIECYDGERIKGLINYTLDCFAKNGSTYVEIDKFYKFVSDTSFNSLYKIKIPYGLISIQLNNLSWIYVDKDERAVYFKNIWEMEQDISKHIFRLKNNSKKNKFDICILNELESELDVKYSPDQKYAFNILKSTGIKILTGGPGTGKTTLIKGLIHMYKKIYPNNKVTLCAPTGMAAEKLAKSTGHNALTIHKTIEYTPFSEKYATYLNETNPLDTDCIFIDEASMIDTELASMLLGAIKSDALVVFCGDVDQLDSIGPGSVLHDMINSEKVEVYRLNTLFRQRESSKIISNSKKIIKEDKRLITDERFIIKRYKDKDELYGLITNIINKKNLKNTQILSTSNKNNAGTRALNNLIQDKISYKSGRCIRRNGYTFHKGDKILTIRNNYKGGYFNGDIGYITDINEDGNIMIGIDNNIIPMKFSWLEDIVPAYAITVHKAQGSEFDTVVIVLPKNPSIMLDKNLIYTSITRSKKNVIILSENDALEKGIITNKRAYRRTGLCNKINKHYI